MAASPLRTLLSPALTASPRETVFWTGAGVSADAPTSGPLGTALADRALGHAFAPGTAATIAAYYRKLNLRRHRPRLETLLDVVIRVHGQALLDDLFSDLAVAKPNGLHSLFASHLALGGRHITANFDTCIERAGGRGSSFDVIHFHGSLGAGPLGATLERIERGLPTRMRDELQNVLTGRGTRLLVFVGYSGLDFFDVDPFFAHLPRGSLVGRTIIWVNHSRTAPQLVPPTRRQLEWLRAAGATTLEIEAPTRDVLQALADLWGLTITAPPGSAVPWHSTVTVADAAKELATLELYALMNLHAEVHRRVQTPSAAVEWELLANTLWAEGRYRVAGVAWARARAAGSETARAERRAAIHWIRGEFRKARRELMSALADGSAPLEERLLVAELFARVLVHMRRFPDSRLRPSRRLREQALAELADPDQLDASGKPLGTHLRIRVASARAALGAAKPSDRDAIASFGEYEALGAQLNYRHAALRARLRVDDVDPEELAELRAHFLAIGAAGDAARATLLGGVAVFGIRDVARAAWTLDVTNWHRFRLIGASLAATAARSIRKLRRRAR